MSQNIFAYSVVSELSKHFFILGKKIAFLIGGGRTPPPPPPLLRALILKTYSSFQPLEKGFLAITKIWNPTKSCQSVEEMNYMQQRPSSNIQYMRKGDYFFESFCNILIKGELNKIFFSVPI